jgi:hypothetical protein
LDSVFAKHKSKKGRGWSWRWIAKSALRPLKAPMGRSDGSPVRQHTEIFSWLPGKTAH